MTTTKKSCAFPDETVNNYTAWDRKFVKLSWSFPSGEIAPGTLIEPQAVIPDLLPGVEAWGSAITEWNISYFMRQFTLSKEAKAVRDCLRVCAQVCG